MSTFKHKFVTFIKPESVIFKIIYDNFFRDTQVTSAIEVIRGWRLSDYFQLYLKGLAPDP